MSDALRAACRGCLLTSSATIFMFACNPAHAPDSAPISDAGRVSPCVPESPQATCTRLDYPCGTWDAFDNCGAAVQVTCACPPDGGPIADAGQAAQDGGAGCSPACPDTQVCVDQTCVPACANFRCPPGSACTSGATGPQCGPVTTSGELGSPCGSDGDCSTGTVCLMPYGSLTTGVCTMACDPSASSCAASGGVCTAFQSDGVQTLNLCVLPSLLPCTSDAVCAPFGLLCEIMYVDTNSASDAGPTYAAAAACGAPAPAGIAEGEPCSFTAGSLCVSGLCIIENGAGGDTDRICSTPCSEAADCTGFSSGGTLGACLPVSIKEQAGTPIVRALLCANGGATIGMPCSPPGSACNADAPECVPSMADPTASICAPWCVPGPAACTVEALSLTCDESGPNAGICI